MIRITLFSYVCVPLCRSDSDIIQICNLPNSLPFGRIRRLPPLPGLSVRENVTVADPEANGSTNSSSVAVAILVPFFALIFAGLGFYLYKQRYVARKDKAKSKLWQFACRLGRLTTLALMLCKYLSLSLFLSFFFLVSEPNLT